MEKWTKWYPKEIDVRGQYVDWANIVSDINGLTIDIVLLRHSQNIKLLFENCVYAYQSIDEGDRWKTLDFLSDSYGKDFFDHFLYKVSNSNYVKWLNEETYFKYKDTLINHYVITTQENIVDVLSSYDPKVIVEKNIQFE